MLPPEADLRRAGDARADPLARRFGDALRAGDAASAEAVIEEALRQGLEPPAIQVRVIEPAMGRIGELWETGYLTVADERRP